MKKTTKAVLMVFMILILLAAAAYLAVGVYYQDKFFPGSVVNGIDASGMTVAEVENEIANEVQDYSLTITERGGNTEVIEGAEMLFQYVSNGAVQKLKDGQNSFQWILAYFEPETYSMTAQTTYDKEMLKTAMLKLNAFDETQVTAPEDAYINETSDGYEMVDEVAGNQLNEEKTFEMLCLAVDQGSTEINLEDTDCYNQPKVGSDNKKLNKKLKVLKKYGKLTITYNIAEGKEVLNYATFRDWMKVSDKGEVTFDWNYVADWVAALADKYDTFGKDQTFTTSYNEKITIQNETFGWKLDEETEAAWIQERLTAGESAERDPSWLETAQGWGENDIGNTYIEIDITNQHMWFYKDGQLLVDTKVVTGDSTKGYDTPTGVFCIYSKEYLAILKGSDNLTGKNYNTPVDYWMPFSGGCGIHDAKWRTGGFGGTIYQGGGSHGCVNTPWGNAKTIYENADVGTPVIIYDNVTYQGESVEGYDQPAETRVIDSKGNEVKEGETAATEAGETTASESTADTSSSDYAGDEDDNMGVDTSSDDGVTVIE